jgi:hypothetical protein
MSIEQININTSIDKQDIKKLETYKNQYVSGNYSECLFGLNKLVEKYKDYTEYNNFYVDLLFSYANICNIFPQDVCNTLNKNNNYEDKIHDIMNRLSTIGISDNLKEFCKSNFTFLCLHKKEYLHKNAYLSHINSIKGPNISSNNMSFLTKLIRTRLSLFMTEAE